MYRVEEREAITFVNEGQKLFGILHRPLHVKLAPAVLFCPGFAGSKVGKHRIFVILAQRLAQMGFVVLRFDYRGAGDSEGDFQEITIESKVSDTLRALEFLAQDSQVDTEKMGLLGRSLGGAIAVLAARRYAHIKSLALWAPVFNADHWKALWMAQKNKELAMQMSQATSLPIPNIEFLEQFFNIRLEEELTHLQEIPLLHIHGHKDSVVSIQHAHAYRHQRQDSSHSQFIELPLSDHDFSDFQERMHAIDMTCNWFDQTLK